MTPEQRALAAAFLAECWPVCREESREDRAVKRALDAADAELLRSSQPVEKAAETVEKGAA